VIEPPPSTILGLHEACRRLTAGGVEVVTPGATLRAGERVALLDGFSASGDLAVELDTQLTPFSWVRDPSPGFETSYTADFHVRLDGLALGAGDRLHLFVGRSAAGGVSFRIVLRSDGAGGVEVLLEARLDDGTYAATPAGQEVSLPAGWLRVRLDWRAGAGDGSLSIAVDGVPSGELPGLANGARRVATVDWGVAAGSLDATTGFIDLDVFRSW
jgi:hypothetical protein